MNKRIHVVEDDEDIRYIIEYILKDSEFEVSSSATACEFCTSIQGLHPDLILLDIMLPDGDGRDICRKLKSDLKTKDIPVIMMSAHTAEKDVVAQCLANDFIKKPFDIEFFMNRVHLHLNN